MRANIPLLLLAVAHLAWVPLRTGDSPNDPNLRWSNGYAVPYHVHSDGYSGLPFNRVQAALDAAFSTWETPCSTLRFDFVRGVDGDTPAMDGQNIIRFEERRLDPEVDPDSTLAFTSHVGAYCTGVLVESDITFNAVVFGWSDSRNSQFADIETVALHEIGHLLGLDHTADPDTVMYPSIQQRLRRDLSRDEDNAICALYSRDVGAVCERDADCPRDDVCQFGPQSNESLAARCGPPIGRGQSGDRCNPEASLCDAGCANGLCLGDGRCAALCRNDRDCDGGRSCLEDPGGEASLRYCVDLRLCEDDIDACPAGEACVFTQHPSEPRLMRLCIEAPGRTPVGEACNRDEECAGALCFGVCTAVCDGAPDCPGSFECAVVDIPLEGGATDSVGLCQFEEVPCSRPADCDDDLACVFMSDGETVVSQCIPNPGGPAGTPCNDYEDCRSGLCLREGNCSDACQNADDCPIDWICEGIRAGDALIDACVPDDTPPAGPDAGLGRTDAAIAPGPDAAVPSADAGVGAPSDSGAITPGADGGGSPPPSADGGTTPPGNPFDPFGPGSAPDAQAPPTRVPGVVRTSSGGSGGCNVIVGDASIPWWLMAALALALRRRNWG